MNKTEKNYLNELHIMTPDMIALSFQNIDMDTLWLDKGMISEDMRIKGMCVMPEEVSYRDLYSEMSKEKRSESIKAIIESSVNQDIEEVMDRICLKFNLVEDDNDDESTSDIKSKKREANFKEQSTLINARYVSAFNNLNYNLKNYKPEGKK